MVWEDGGREAPSYPISVRDDRDHGTIIDFAQLRGGGSLGEIRKTLRQWVGGSVPEYVPKPAADAFVDDLIHIRKDLIAVRLEYENMKPIDGHHKYLEEERKIPWHILSDPLFVDRIRSDSRKNAVFPHFNREGLCGFERKNTGFTGYATGAVKGLWCSNFNPDDQRLIIAESAIDALSYAALKAKPNSRYVSTSGQLSPDQIFLLQSAIEKLPDGGEVILAVDHDEGGDKIGSRIEAIFALVNRPALSLHYDRPPMLDTDWNDELRKPPVTILTPLPMPRPRPHR